MKKMKKLATLLLAVCLMVPCFSILTYAKNAIMFEDPSTAVGETLTLKGVVELDTDIEDRKVVMSYNTEMLKFKESENITEDTPGQLTYNATGEAGGKRAEFVITFDVLKEGTTKVEVTSHQVYNTSDRLITCQQGSSTITIAAGNASAVTSGDSDENEPVDASAIVYVNGVAYTFSDNFTAEDILPGFVETTIEYAGTDYKVIMQESSGLTLGYLVDSDAEGKFFVYVADNATFAPYETLNISESTTIVLLTTVEDVVLPDTYVETNVTVNGVEFPGWQNAEEPDYCLLYAMNQLGEESLYRFDIQEGTYQRFEAPVVEQVEEEKPSMFGTLAEVLQSHLDYVVLGAGFGFILFVLIVVILSVKLYNRNAELDELYDEYGLLDDEDDEDEEDEEDVYENMVINIDDEDAPEEDGEEIVEADDEETIEAEDNEEVEVVQEEQVVFADIEEEVEDDIKELEAALQEDDEKYFDDDDDTEFEMDFIDLDD